MLSFLAEAVQASWTLLNQAAFYILFGLLVGGLLKTFLSPAYVAKHLGKGRFSSVFKAALLGVPIPLCSCGVLPAAATLKKQGANNGAVAAFLISTPESGVDSITMTWALLDPIMTVARPVSAFISAAVAGLLENSISFKPPQAAPPSPFRMAGASVPAEPAPPQGFIAKLQAGVRYMVNDLWPDIAGWFADYASVMFKALDDRVKMWATLNEPWVVTDGGYLHGALAPGHKNLFEAPIASHNLLRSHASAVQAYRAEGRNRIGLVVNIEPKDPASDSPEDLAATARADAYMNRQYLDPAIHGRYPEEMREIFGEAWPDFPQAELDHIRQPIDFLGINYYTRSVTCDDPKALPVRAGRVRQTRHAYTETDWEVYPPGLTNTLVWIRKQYGELPLYVTENGAAFYDPPMAEGDELSDPLRVSYFRTHLRAAREAIRQGVDLRGYFAWSLLDNFEWSLGYSKRFGIVHVDFETQRRTPKASARLYSEVIRTRGACL